MSSKMRRGAALVALLMGVFLGSCGNPATPPKQDNEKKSLPFAVTEVFLRPRAMVRTSQLSRGLPTPTLAAYHLTAFYEGGSSLAEFGWQVPDSVGTLEPKSFTLGLREATVLVQPRERLPLGIFEFGALGRSGSETDSAKGRFAIIENAWMKHARVTYQGRTPENLVSFPCWLPGQSGQRSDDGILFVGASSVLNTKLWCMSAYKQLTTPDNAADIQPWQPFLAPEASPPAQPSNPNGAASADVAPAGLGWEEILFSSQLDMQYESRCPSNTCQPGFPFNIWIVKRASNPILPNRARPLTWDESHLAPDSSTKWNAYDYLQPRWDPSSSGSGARIAFLSNRGRSGTRADDLWLADVRDASGDGTLDTLVNYRRLTDGGAVTSYAWHPRSGRIYFTSGGSLRELDPEATSPGAGTAIVVPGTGLTQIKYVTVFWRQGERPLVAFQAMAENMINLCLYEEDDAGAPIAGSLVRLLPYPLVGPVVSNGLFPRWHPTRKELVYVSDYSVEAWTVGDRMPRNNPEAYGQRRTLYPSVWALRLE